MCVHVGSISLPLIPSKNLFLPRQYVHLLWYVHRMYLLEPRYCYFRGLMTGLRRQCIEYISSGAIVGFYLGRRLIFAKQMANNDRPPSLKLPTTMLIIDPKVSHKNADEYIIAVIKLSELESMNWFIMPLLFSLNPLGHEICTKFSKGPEYFKMQLFCQSFTGDLI